MLQREALSLHCLFLRRWPAWAARMSPPRSPCRARRAGPRTRGSRAACSSGPASPYHRKKWSPLKRYLRRSREILNVSHCMQKQCQIFFTMSLTPIKNLLSNFRETRHFSPLKKVFWVLFKHHFFIEPGNWKHWQQYWPIFLAINWSLQKLLVYIQLTHLYLLFRSFSLVGKLFH